MTGTDPPRLERRLGLGGATAIGLAAMLGTGVFAAWTPALRWSGPLLLVSLAIAAVVASLNAWSTVALARLHPEAGGAYAYGRIRLGRAAGVVAGWAFVLGKAASAGAAALTVGVYLWPGQQRLVAVAAILLVVVLDLRGVTRTALASAVSAAVVIVVLVLVVAQARASSSSIDAADAPVLPMSPGVLGVLAGAGLLFVAFAGYARIATLGEEVRDPSRVLPRAVLVSLVVVLVIYCAVASVVLLRLGPVPPDLRSAAPLEQLAQEAWLAGLVRAGAVVAAGGALLSLVAGIGRTLFAMARGGDAPRGLSGVSAYGVPHRAQLVAGAGAALVALAGGIGAALAVSGASILLYYGVAHLAALRLGPDDGRPPRAVPALGLLGCVLVAGSLVLVAAGAVPTAR